MFPEKPMEPLTSEEWKEYNLSNKCHICSKRIKDIKVRDHCHYMGKYRGPAHRDYNLKYSIPSYIPIMFHNLRRYDAHLFIRGLGRSSDKIGVIAEDKEKYISFKTEVVIGEYMDKKGEIKDKKIQLRFIDSMRFMASSWDSLTNNLVKGGQHLTGFKDYTKEQYELLIRKSVYPYKYMTNWEKFKETKFPPMKRSIAILT